LHLTDIHLLDDIHEDIRGFNTYESLNAVIQKIKDEQTDFEFIVVSGDISQTNNLKSYQLFKNTLQKLDKPVYCIPGNHDNPQLLKTFFPKTPINNITSIEHDNNLILFINTQVKNEQFGQISESNLYEISQLLDAKKQLSAIIVLHHPPVATKSEWMDNIGLKNGPDFLASVRQYPNLKLILFGHVHQQIDASFQHVQLCATPSTCYQFKPGTPTIEYDKLTAGYRLVKITNDGTIHSSVSRI